MRGLIARTRRGELCGLGSSSLDGGAATRLSSFEIVALEAPRSSSVSAASISVSTASARGTIWR